MKIFILDKFKITKFNLPEKVDDSFLVPYIGYDGKNDDFVTVEANNDKWQLKSNGTVNIIDGTNILDSVLIDNYSCYSLKILGQQEYATLFALPSKDEETYKLEIKNLTSITIGSSNANITYRNNLTAKLHAEIKFVNNDWYIAGSTDDSYRTYINGDRILTAKLNIGDVIFINGLKIIWMKTFIKINNPKGCVTVSGLSALQELDIVDNTKYTPVTDEEANVDLYDEDEYFYHMPRLVPVITPENFNIDPPVVSQQEEEVPFLLTIGTSFTMVASSGVMIYNIINSINNGRSITTMIPQMIMCISILIGSLIMPRILRAYQKRRHKKKLKEYRTKYKEYLSKENQKIQYALKAQSQILNEINLSTKNCYNAILNKNRNFWSREITDEDFLRVRLGIGNIDSFVNVSVPEEHFSISTDDLQEEVFKVGKDSKKLENVPITINIPNQNILSLIFNCSYKDDYINSLITQIVSLNSSVDLKLVILTNEQKEKRWEYVKYLPHIWSDDKQARFFATNSNEYKVVSSYLEDEFKNRTVALEKVNSSEPTDESNQRTNRNLKYRLCPPYYLIITDDYKSIKNLPLITMLQDTKVNYGFSMLIISNSIRSLPNKCEKFIEFGEKEGCILERKISSQSQVIFTPEYEKNLDMNLISIKLANAPTLTKDGLSVLPTSLSFLDMYGVGKIEQLNILNRWQTNNPVTSLSTPIGVHADGEEFKLDLHEKFHGPHGLIAGSTGSGKSEFIITYILSMCVNYHPYEVQFVLIDYKGGGLAGAFENKETGVKIPHLVGTITNLDTAEMNRTLVSISSELKRRQRKFNEVKDKLNESTMDIYKYQKLYREGLIDEPMAHLFIISDEFAELKSQQPEFLSELVSTARIGRSLGVHLILATQKPSGVVNDQIWSNSKFKVCLKVQDRSDSMEMLKRPEAASIKEAGRFYLQVGYDDYFDIGQSGYGGVKYVPTDKIIKKVDDSICFVNNTGEIIKTINDIAKKETTEDLGEQLTNIVKYIYNLGKKENIVTRKMWLDNIPPIIFYNNLRTKYSYKPIPYVINPVIGEFDNPSAQSQGLLNLNIQNNVLIYGKSGSGKENLLQIILWASMLEHTPEEVNFYIIDCGAESLKMFNKMPHVGEISVQDDSDKIIDTFNMILEELERRKEAYSDYVGSFQNYNENSGNRDPLIVTIINNYDVFSETYGKLSEQIQTLYRDGQKYGITFIISCISASAIRGKMQQFFQEKITLQMPNPDDYRSILSCPKNLIPSNYFGRGLINVNSRTFEFQTALICDNKDLNNVVKSVSKQLCDGYITRAKKVPTVPKVVTLDTLKDCIPSLTEFPIGYGIIKKQIYTYNLFEKKILSIISENMPSRLNFIWAIIKQLKTIPKVEVKIVDFVNVCKDRFKDITVYDKDFENSIILINNAIANEKSSQTLTYYIFIGIGEIDTELSDKGKQILNTIMMTPSILQKSYFILVDNYSSFKRLELYQWYKSQVDTSNGIWLGPNIANQMVFNIPNINMDIRNLDFPEMGFAIENNEFDIIKYVIDEEESHEK